MAKTKMERLKDGLFWGFIIFFLVLPFLAGIFGPGMLENHIKKHNPPEAPVKPWATKYRYYLGVCYDFRLNEKDAQRVYLESIDWYNDEERNIPEDDIWIGRSVFNYGALLWAKRKRQFAIQYFEFFLEQWSEHPEVDKKKVLQAEKRLRISRSGG
ncbi:MAG: tetratricopeptide repeat protein [Planctomycetota bacterium]|jgi:hypothetical protein